MRLPVASRRYPIWQDYAWRALSLTLFAAVALALLARWGVPSDPLLMVLCGVLLYSGGVLFHEAGHAALGVLAGYELQAVHLGSLSIQRENGRWRWRRSYLNVVGAVALWPPRTADLRGPTLAMLCGGWLGSLTAGVLYMLAAEPVRTQDWPLAAGLSNGLIIGGGLSLATAIVSLLPYRTGPILTDGENIWALLRRSSQGMRRLKLIQLSRYDKEGAMPNDWPVDLLDGIEQPRDGLLDDARAHYYVFQHRIATGDREGALRLDADVRNDLGRFHPALARALLLEAAFIAAYYRNDAGAGREDFREAMKRRHPVDPALIKRSEAAVLLAEGTREQAGRKAREALDVLSGEPTTTRKLMEAELRRIVELAASRAVPDRVSSS